MKDKKSLAVGLTIFLLFISMEAALRVRQYIRNGVFFDEGTALYIKDPVLGEVLRPGAAIGGRSSSVTINRWGFRGRDFNEEKGAGVFRIIALGDSVVFERYAANDDSTWTATLEEMLNRRQSRYRVEVINAGVSGYNVDTVYLYLKNRIARFKPDLIILYQGSNDINYQCRILYGSGRTKQADAFSLSRLREKYFLWFDLLRDKTASLLASEQKTVRFNRMNDAAVRNYGAGLVRIIEYCKENRIALMPSTVARSFRKDQPGWVQVKMASSMMVYNPYLTIEGLNDAFDRFNGEIRDLSGKRGLAMVDIDKSIPPGEKYFRDHVHFTDAGDRKVAGIFADVILRDYLN